MLRLRVVTIIAGIFLASVFSSAAFADTVLSVVPASSTVSTGDNFAVDVNISGVTDLYAFQFDLGFDPTVLQATNVMESIFLPGGGATFFIPGTIDNTTGNVTFNADTLLSAVSGVSGNGALVEFDFAALASGTSVLDLSNIALLDSSLNNINDTSTNGSVTVQGATSVPEPSVLMLLSAGLLAIGGFTLKKTVL